MSPRICRGDIVIVRLQDTVEDGDIAVVIVGDDTATCKKVVVLPTGIVLSSFNTAYQKAVGSNPASTTTKQPHNA